MSLLEHRNSATASLLGKPRHVPIARYQTTFKQSPLRTIAYSAKMCSVDSAKVCPILQEKTSQLEMERADQKAFQSTAQGRVLHMDLGTAPPTDLQAAAGPSGSRQLQLLGLCLIRGTDGP